MEEADAPKKAESPKRYTCKLLVLIDPRLQRRSTAPSCPDARQTPRIRRMMSVVELLPSSVRTMSWPP